MSLNLTTVYKIPLDQAERWYIFIIYGTIKGRGSENYMDVG